MEDPDFGPAGVAGIVAEHQFQVVTGLTSIQLDWQLENTIRRNGSAGRPNGLVRDNRLVVHHEGQAAVRIADPGQGQPAVRREEAAVDRRGQQQDRRCRIHREDLVEEKTVPIRVGSAEAQGVVAVSKAA